MKDFKVGELVVFIGKRLCKDGAFVNYHTGETAAKTNYSDLYKIKNSYVIEKENLGGGLE